MKKSLNLPNVLTSLRAIIVPFFIYLILQPSLVSRFIAFVLFIIASLTDFADGYLARKWKQETEFGKFLDPLADKALVVGALITFIFISEQVQIWMVLCIIGRDLMITLMRYLAIHRGTTLRTSMFGKVKTAFQMFAIVMILLSFLMVSSKDRAEINKTYSEARESGYSLANVAFANLHNYIYKDGSSDDISVHSRSMATFLPYYLMLITTFLTIVSGIRYLFTNYRLFLPRPLNDDHPA